MTITKNNSISQYLKEVSAPNAVLQPLAYQQW
ncbi:Uncharacterised protein, partial [Mesomycoplasma hyorhinis]